MAPPKTNRVWAITTKYSPDSKKRFGAVAKSHKITITELQRLAMLQYVEQHEKAA